MAITKTVWTGGSATATIGNIKLTGNIKSYDFTVPTDLTKGTLNGASLPVTAPSKISAAGGTKDFSITGHLTYKHYSSGTTFATSNETNACTLTVHLALNSDSVSSLGVSPTYVWSNDAAKEITLNVNTNTTYIPYSTSNTISSDSTSNSNNKGSVPSLTTAATDVTRKVTWTPSNSSDLGAASRPIKFTVNSTTSSAASAAGIKEGTLTVRNAVTALAATGKTLYASSTKNNTVSVGFTPTTPFSTELILVGETNDTAPSASNGCSISLSGTTLTFACSSPTSKTTTTTMKCRVKSVQGASAVYSDVITFVSTGVTALTGQSVTEGNTITVAGGIGTISTIKVNSGQVTATKNASDGTKLDIKGLAVTENTSYSITITNADGATNTISGTTVAITDATLAINTGDRYTKTMSVGAISGTPSNTNTTVATVTVNGSDLIVDAKKAGTATITVTGTNGATQNLVVTVSDVTLAIS